MRKGSTSWSCGVPMRRLSLTPAPSLAGVPRASLATGRIVERDWPSMVCAPVLSAAAAQQGAGVLGDVAALEARQLELVRAGLAFTLAAGNRGDAVGRSAGDLIHAQHALCTGGHDTHHQPHMQQI